MPSKTKTQGAGADNDDGPIPIFNEKDLRFIRAVMENMDGRPDVDWAKVAEEYGDTKDDKQAKEKYRVLAIKFGWNGQTKSPATRHAKPTESDMRFVKAIFGNMTGKPDTDWEKVARDYGDTKDVKQAKEKYRVTAFKYGWVRKTPTKTAAKRASGPVSAAKATRSRDIEGTPGTVVAETTTTAPPPTAGKKRGIDHDEKDGEDARPAPAKRPFRTPVPSARPSKPAAHQTGPLFPNLPTGNNTSAAFPHFPLGNNNPPRFPNGSPVGGSTSSLDAFANLSRAWRPSFLGPLVMVNAGTQTTPHVRDVGIQAYTNPDESDGEV